ncbi:hypothetical protein [Streptomyces sp. NPDC047123]|uniref:hypothetical protein n=1 Tax=Streptomyces sp. NPDC047123 TaxID=3155622 RepID=UPI0033C8FC94
MTSKAEPEVASEAGSDVASKADPEVASEAGSDVASAVDADAVSGEASEEGEGSAGRGGGLRRSRVLVRYVVPSVCAALLVLGGSGFFYGAHQLRSDPSAGNQALTDAEETTRVGGDVGNALAHIFSYTPDGLDTTESAARSVLAGRAERQYTELMGRVRKDLAARRVTLSTQAVRTGVIELDGDRARLLVFLDQISHRGKADTAAAAQLTVTAQREDDRWRIVDIRTR